MPHFDNKGMTAEKWNALPKEEQARRLKMAQEGLERLHKKCPNCGYNLKD